MKLFALVSEVAYVLLATEAAPAAEAVSHAAYRRLAREAVPIFALRAREARGLALALGRVENVIVNELRSCHGGP